MSKNIPSYNIKAQYNPGGAQAPMRTTGYISPDAGQVSINALQVRNTPRLSPGREIQARVYKPPYEIEPKTGAMIADLGNAVFQAAMHYRDKYDSQVALDKYLDLKSRVRALAYGEPGDDSYKGYLQLHGQAAIEKSGEFVDSINGIYQENLDSLTANQKQKYVAMSADYFNKVLDKAAQKKASAVAEKDAEQLYAQGRDLSETLVNSPEDVVKAPAGDISQLDAFKNKLTIAVGPEKADSVVDTVLLTAVQSAALNKSGATAKKLFETISPFFVKDISRGSAKRFYEEAITHDKVEAKRQHTELVTKQLNNTFSDLTDELDNGKSYSLQDYLKMFTKIEPKRALSYANLFYNMQQHISKSGEVKSNSITFRNMLTSIVNGYIPDSMDILKFTVSEDADSKPLITLPDAGKLISISNSMRSQAGREVASFYKQALDQAGYFYSKVDKAPDLNAWSVSTKPTQGKQEFREFKHKLSEAFEAHRDDPQAQMTAINQVYQSYGKGKFADNPGHLSHPIHIIHTTSILKDAQLGEKNAHVAATHDFTEQHTFDGKTDEERVAEMERATWNNYTSKIANTTPDETVTKFVKVPVLDFSLSYGAKSNFRRRVFKKVDFGPYSVVASTPDELAWWYSHVADIGREFAPTPKEIKLAKDAMLAKLKINHLIQDGDAHGFYWSNGLDSFLFRNTSGAIKQFTPSTKFFKTHFPATPIQ